MSFKKYLQIGEVFGYFFRKQDPSRPTNGTIKAMHWVNRISIIMFLISVLVIIFRLFIR